MEPIEFENNIKIEDDVTPDAGGGCLGAGAGCIGGGAGCIGPGAGCGFGCGGVVCGGYC